MGVFFSLYFFLGTTTIQGGDLENSMTMYYLKIMEGFTTDVQFDNAQELNSFQVKARGQFKCIDGVKLCLQTIKVEVDSEIVPLLYLRNSVQFPQYKHILFNHIQTMLNFHMSRYSDDVIS